jgi:hypothetical protein
LSKLSALESLSALLIALVVLSIILGVSSMFPVATPNLESSAIINATFTLTQNQVRRQGLGTFGGGENLTVVAESPTAFYKELSIVTYSGTYYVNSTTLNVNYTFTADADYYEAVFYSNSPEPGVVHFQVMETHRQVLFPLDWLSQPAKILFFISLTALMLMLIRHTLATKIKSAKKPSLPLISSINRRRLAGLVVLSLMVWLILVAINTNPLATFENWYTDHARHDYVSSLFFKDGFNIFSQPLDRLASLDASPYKFVTWPEMPHLYPLGSIFLFMPFGALLQNGINAELVYKLEILLFVVVAHICLYFFLKVFLKKDLRVAWRLVGVYIIYVALITYAADGMFDSIAFIFSLFAVTMFLTERYDWFLLFVGTSVFFKYQAGIFLLPLIFIGAIELFRENKLDNLLRSKKVVLGLILICATFATAYVSAPYLLQTRPQLIMNGVNAFASNAQIPWIVQSFSVLLTLTATLSYALYMRNRNSLLSLSSLFMLVPSFLLPYFQNWYLPFIFIYILLPQTKKDTEATMLWLIFMMGVLSFGGAAFNPMLIIDNFRITFHI